MKEIFIYVPAYWWYSVKYKTRASILRFNYRTYMNTLSILPHICMSALQKQNTKFNIVEKISGIQPKVQEPK